MNSWGGFWTVAAVALVGLGAWLAVLGWPFLQTLAPESPPGQLLRVAEALSGAQDLVARVTVKGEGDEPVKVLVRYIATPAVRVDLLEPEALQGELYTLRPIVDGWLLVHYRPREEAGVEVLVDAPEWLTGLFNVPRLRAGIQLGHIAVSSPASKVLDVRGPPGPFQRLVVHLGDDDLLVEQLVVYGMANGREVAVLEAHIEELALDQGLEFRELLSLPQPARRWFRG